MPQRKGQHFLVSSSVAEKILEIAEVRDTDIILEIGPGKGALTDLLVRRARKVIALEIDANLVKFLKERFSQSKNIEIIHADALKHDYDKIPDKVKIVANLPYYISTPLIRMSTAG
jgi:16S rRNA (adenine1518-N6/adenine1519-N6)-dimethyltransferase